MNFKFSALLLFLVLAACSSLPHAAFNKLRVGDDKGTVIEQLGSPKQSYRKDEKDYWVYRYYRNDTEFKRVLVFAAAKLVSLGNEERIFDPDELRIEQDLENMDKGRPSSGR